MVYSPRLYGIADRCFPVVVPRDTEHLVRETNVQAARRQVREAERLLERQEDIVAQMDGMSSAKARELGHDLLRIMRQSVEAAKRHLAKLDRLK